MNGNYSLYEGLIELINSGPYAYKVKNFVIFDHQGLHRISTIEKGEWKVSCGISPPLTVCTIFLIVVLFFGHMAKGQNWPKAKRYPGIP